METRDQFVVETNGCCFICFQPSTSTPVRPSPSPGISPAGDKTTPNAGKNARGRPPKHVTAARRSASSHEGGVFSLQTVIEQLKLDVRKVFGDMIAVSPSSLPGMERSNLKGNLCGSCIVLVRQFSEAYVELERIHKMVYSSLSSIQSNITRVDNDDEAMNKFTSAMWNRPHTLLHYGLVNRLRQEAVTKCSLLMKIVGPDSLRLKPEHSVSETLSSTFINTDPAKIKVENETNDESFAIPLISSVQGNYKTRRNTNERQAVSSSANNEETEPTTSIGIYPVPVQVQIQEEEQDQNIVLNGIGNKIKRSKSEGFEHMASPQSRHSLQKHSSSARNIRIPAKFRSSEDTFQDFSVKKQRDSATPSEGIAAIIKSGLSQPGYSCDLCPMKFKARYLLADHKRVVHLGITFKCALCPDEFKTRSDFQKHNRFMHNNRVGNTGTGIIYFPGGANSKMHNARKRRGRRGRPKGVKNRTKNNVTDIPLTGEMESAASATTLGEIGTANPAPSTSSIFAPERLKIRLHIPKPSYSISSGFISKSKPSSAIGANRFKCDLCSETFKLKYLLFDHNRTVHLKKPFGCAQCKPTLYFKERADYSRHYRIVHINKLKETDCKGWTVNERTEKKKNVAEGEVNGLNRSYNENADSEDDYDEQENEEEMEMDVNEGENVNVPIPIPIFANGEDHRKEEDDDRDLKEMTVPITLVGRRPSASSSASSASATKLSTLNHKTNKENGWGTGGDHKQETKKFQCIACSKTFQMSGALQMHMKKSDCQYYLLRELELEPSTTD